MKLRFSMLPGLLAFACGCDLPKATPVGDTAQGVTVSDGGAPLDLADAFGSCARFGTVGFPPGGDAGDMQHALVPTSVFPEAVCNDGTPALFYFRPGKGEGLHSWLIELEGGGGCQRPEECARRYCALDEDGGHDSFGKQHMGSDDYVDRIPQLAATGIQSIDAGPFADYNHVFIHYCSSDAWRGVSPNTVADADIPNTTTQVTFTAGYNGNAILQAVLSILRREGAVLPPFHLDDNPRDLPDLDDATGTVVIAGGSAGGVGVIYQLDRVVATLAPHDPSNPVYAGFIDSAFTPNLGSIDFASTPGCDAGGACRYDEYILSQLAYYGTLHDQNCRALHPGGGLGGGLDEVPCDDPTHVIRNHVQTPFFVEQGEMDQVLSKRYVPSLMDDAGFETRVRQQAWDLHDLSTRSEITLTKDPGAFVPDCKKHYPIAEDDAFFHTSIDGVHWEGPWSNWIRNVTPAVLVGAPDAGLDSSCPAD